MDPFVSPLIQARFLFLMIGQPSPFQCSALFHSSPCGVPLSKLGHCTFPDQISPPHSPSALSWNPIRESIFESTSASAGAETSVKFCLYSAGVIYVLILHRQETGASLGLLLSLWPCVPPQFSYSALTVHLRESIC